MNSGQTVSSVLEGNKRKGKQQ